MKLKTKTNGILIELEMCGSPVVTTEFWIIMIVTTIYCLLYTSAHYTTQMETHLIYIINGVFFHVCK